MMANTTHSIKPQTKPDYLLCRVMGGFHSWWIKNPLEFGLILFIFAGCVNFSAIYLGIWDNFNCRYIDKCSGFSSLNWGWLFVWALPLTSILIAYFLRLISDAIRSLDTIIIPVKKEKSGGEGEEKEKGNKYSEHLARRLKKGWKYLWCLSLISIFALVLWADLPDILYPIKEHPSDIPLPLQFNNKPYNIDWSIIDNCIRKNKTRQKNQKGDQEDIQEDRIREFKKYEWDWSNHGFLVSKSFHPDWSYLIFNVSAFSMEGLLGIWGVLILFGVVGLNQVIVKDLSDLEFQRQEIKRTQAQPSLEYEINWQWEGKNKRCGLHEFDKVFAVYLFLTFLALAFFSISVTSQMNKSQLDTGGWIAAVGSFLLLLNTCRWLIWPYWSFFPDKNEKNQEDEIHKAPFGTKNFFWIILSAYWAGWSSIFYIIVIRFGISS